MLPGNLWNEVAWNKMLLYVWMEIISISSSNLINYNQNCIWSSEMRYEIRSQEALCVCVTVLARFFQFEEQLSSCLLVLCKLPLKQSKWDCGSCLKAQQKFRALSPKFLITLPSTYATLEKGKCGAVDSHGVSCWIAMTEVSKGETKTFLMNSSFWLDFKILFVQGERTRNM